MGAEPEGCQMGNSELPELPQDGRKEYLVMDIKLANYLRANFLLEQQSAYIEGAFPLDVYFEPCDTKGAICPLNSKVICGKQPGESCEGCPVWKEIDGE